MTVTIAGAGTDESTWLPWLTSQTWPPLDLAAVAGRRVVVLAAHPDDEVLGAGGVMVSLAMRDHPIVLVWATDGEASHPRSTAMSQPDLRQARRRESSDALDRLGVAPAATHHLGLPDGGLASCRTELRTALRRIVRPDDLVVAPWRGDGHPDHDVLGDEACSVGSATWQYPIWMWHWALPDDARVPWDQIRVSPVVDVTAKVSAISMFTSQVEPIGPGSDDAAILPPHVVARFARRFEWIIT